MRARKPLRKSEISVLVALAISLSSKPTGVSFIMLKQATGLSHGGLSLALKRLVEKGIIRRVLVRTFPRKVIYRFRREFQLLISSKNFQAMVKRYGVLSAELARIREKLTKQIERARKSF